MLNSALSAFGHQHLGTELYFITFLLEGSVAHQNHDHLRNIRQHPPWTAPFLRYHSGLGARVRLKTYMMLSIEQWHNVVLIGIGSSIKFCRSPELARE